MLIATASLVKFFCKIYPDILNISINIYTAYSLVANIFTLKNFQVPSSYFNKTFGCNLPV